MKKVLVIMLSLVLLLLSGCSKKVADDNFLSTMPWTPHGASTEKFLGEEVCEYKMTRYAGAAKDGVAITEPESSLLYTLKEGCSFELSQNGTVNAVALADYTLLTAKLNVQYKNTDDVPDLFKGATEQIVSYCVFGSYDLKPLKTYRKVDTVDTAHTLKLDYTENRATLIDGFGEQTMSIKSGGYDNESLYYLLRALTSITEGGTAALPLVLAYDDFKYENNNVKSKEIIQTTASELVDLTVAQSVYLQFENGGENSTLSCYETSVKLNTSKSGSATKLYYSKNKANTASTGINSVSYAAQNVLIKIEYPLYGYVSGALDLDYTQVFELTKYTNK